MTAALPGSLGYHEVTLMTARTDHTGPVNGVAFSPDGTTRLWD
jgi:hypothetical protein